MVAKDFEVDDLVWAKMKGFPPWPGKIAQPIDKVKAPNLKKPQHFVYFFGTRNYAWILDEHIVPHSEEMMENTKTYKKRSATLQSAIDEIEKEGPRKAVKTQPSEKEASPPQKTDSPILEKPKKIVLKSPKKSPVKKRLLSDSSSEPSPKRLALKKSPKKQELSPEFESSASRNMDLNDDDSSSAPEACVPPNNGYSKVAIIPPYNEQTSNQYTGQTARLLDRPVFARPPTPPLDMQSQSQYLPGKRIKPTDKKIGFLGLGMMGRGMVKNLLDSGHKVTVWNRTIDKCKAFVDAGATLGATPSDVVAECDIIFCCVSDPEVSKKLVFDNCGVLHGLSDRGGWKGYVELSSLDPVTSIEIAEAVSDKGGRYLEAPVIGSRQGAEEGQLMMLGSGDRGLFDACESCFIAMSRNAYFLSCDVGNGSKMNLVVSMLYGTTLAAMAESVALLETLKLSTQSFLEILENGPFAHPLFMAKGRAMLTNNYAVGTALKHQQKDLSLAIGMGNSVDQPLSLAAAANEIFKRAKLLSYSDHDVAAVHLGAKV